MYTTHNENKTPVNLSRNELKVLCENVIKNICNTREKYKQELVEKHEELKQQYETLNIAEKIWHRFVYGPLPDHPKDKHDSVQSMQQWERIGLMHDHVKILAERKLASLENDEQVSLDVETYNLFKEFI